MARYDSLLRDHARADGDKVSTVETFFDLVFVFTITQLSHALLHHLSVEGGLETLLLFAAVWWVWVFTAWVTNWLSPERTAVRIMLFALMLLGLVLSAAIPQAFAAAGPVFALSYVAMQVGRSLFMIWALRHSPGGNRRNFLRITAWLATAGVVWIGGGFCAGTARLGLWCLALGIEYVAPSLGFRVPGLGRSTTRDWDVSGAHMAERCGLFVIIALGEMITMVGAAFAELAWTGPVVLAFVASVVAAIAMWWVYFNIGSERAAHSIARSDDPGAIARVAYTYAHMPIVCGIVLMAVAIELVLEQPLGAASLALRAVTFGAGAIYLAGTLGFKRIMSGGWPLSHLIGLAVFAALWAGSAAFAPAVAMAAAAAALVLVGAWETLSLRGRAPAHATLH